MSRLYWHTQEQTAELLGSEFMWLRLLSRVPAIGAWGLGEDDPDAFERARELVSLVPPEGPGARLRSRLEMPTRMDPPRRRAFLSDLRTLLATEGLHLKVAGVPLHTGDVEMNTALTIGADPVRFAAKISSWARYHCWIEGRDREWAASVIDEGLAAGLYRHGMWSGGRRSADRRWVRQGWDEVRRHLREGYYAPVVLSYSVETWFPNRAIAAWEPDIEPDWRPGWSTEQEWKRMPASHREDCRDAEADERFAALSPEARWCAAMDGLRSTRPWARLGPPTLAQGFNVPVSIHDLFATDRDDRVRRAAAAVDIQGTEDPQLDPSSDPV